MRRTLDRVDVNEALEITGLDEKALYLDYPGRGMFGKTCFGVVVPDVAHVAAFLVALAGAQGYADRGDDIYDLVELAKSTRTDNMGHDIIAYWPDVELV